MSELHTKATEEIAKKEAEIHSLHSRLSTLAADSQNTIRELSKRQRDLENEARWAKEGRSAAEQREGLLRKEIDSFYDQTPSMPGAMQSDQSGRVKSLEKLVAEYKQRVEAMSRDSSELEERLVEGKGLVKQAKLDEAEGRVTSLTKSESR